MEDSVASARRSGSEATAEVLEENGSCSVLLRSRSFKIQNIISKVSYSTEVSANDDVIVSASAVPGVC